ncbi:unnamed protein product [Paramecium primaurelia]|uniref:Uncharacterized protein n=1 Tax=Paramecium primaurelia TaxID=5886 RepID=A0A8S1M5G9_PARPR|nr:unnamed protein product [Paramecium primaurelia]
MRGQECPLCFCQEQSRLRQNVRYKQKCCGLLNYKGQKLKNQLKYYISQRFV